MSIFKLRNDNGSEQIITVGDITHTWPMDATQDLIDDVGLSPSDIFGVEGGDAFEDIGALIRSGLWFLNDGDSDYLREQALHLIKYGTQLHDKDIKRKSKTLVSHDFAVESTWYQTSTQITGQVLSVIDESLDKWESTEKIGCWVNAEQGLIYQEDNDTNVNNKKVKIYVDGIVVNPENYVISYIDKSVTFNSTYLPIPLNAVITADYWLTNDSYWEIPLSSNSLTRLIKTEAQFNSNIYLNSPLIMEVIADHDTAGIIVLEQWQYKSIRDYMGGSNLGYDVPAFGGNKNEAGFLERTVVLPFNFTRPMELPTSKFVLNNYGLTNPRIRFYIYGHQPIKGIFSTVTSYLDEAVL